MMLRIRTAGLLTSAVLISSLFGYLPPANMAQAAPSCSTLLHERSEAFADNAYNLRRAGVNRSELSKMQSTDPRVIEAEYTRWSAILKKWRVMWDRRTPDEEKTMAEKNEMYEDAMDFWRAKKTEESGIPVPSSAGEKWRTVLGQSLAYYEQRRQSTAKQIDRIDAQIARCRAQAHTGSTTSTRTQPSQPHWNWNGTWTGYDYTYQFSGAAGAVSFTFTGANGQDVGQGSCTVKANVATCKVTSHWHAEDKDIERAGTYKLQISGDTISWEGVEDTDTYDFHYGWCKENPDKAASCTEMHPGKQWSGTLSRKK